MPSYHAARLVALILFAYPILIFPMRGAMNGILIFLSLFSIYQLVKTSRAIDSDAILIAVCLGSPLVAILLNQIVTGHFKIQDYDAAARFLLAFPIFLFLRQSSYSMVQWLPYAYCLGAIMSVLMVLFMPHEVGGRVMTGFLDPIHFGDLALLLGFLSVLSIGWLKSEPPFVSFLKWIGILAGIYVSIRSMSRGGWLAIPIVSLWLLFWYRHRWSRRQLLFISLIGLVGMIASYSYVGSIHSRMNAIGDDLASFAQGSKETSVGERLQIWQSAWTVFCQHPIVGVGNAGFQQALDQDRDAGRITGMAAMMGQAEVHNEILAAMARYGMLGFVSVLGLYLIPMVLFLRARRSDSPEKRRAALMGSVTTISFIIFGLTVEMFSLKMVASFYALTIAVFLAITYPLSRSNDDPRT